MSIIDIIILAIIQGITEFLPVSSSAHLILAEKWMGITGEGGNMVIIAVHFGSLFAVMIYFRQEVARMFKGALDLLRFRFKSEDAQLDLKLIVATLPVVVAGFALSRMTWYDNITNSTAVIALAMIGFGLVLYWADKTCAQTRSFDEFNYRDAIIMGLWQAIALIPGTSRSGATVTASRLCGFNRTDGARLAMLMSIPTILAAVMLTSFDIVKDGQATQFGSIAIIAVVASFLAAYCALSLMMRFLKTKSYLPYVIYRVLLGGLLLVAFL